MPEPPSRAEALPTSAAYFHPSKSDSLPPPHYQNFFSDPALPRNTAPHPKLRARSPAASQTMFPDFAHAVTEYPRTEGWPAPCAFPRFGQGATGRLYLGAKKRYQKSAACAIISVSRRRGNPKTFSATWGEIIPKSRVVSNGTRPSSAPPKPRAKPSEKPKDISHAYSANRNQNCTSTRPAPGFPPPPRCCNLSIFLSAGGTTCATSIACNLSRFS